MALVRTLLLMLTCRFCACGNSHNGDEKSTAFHSPEHKLIGVSLDITKKIDKSIFKVDEGNYCGISYYTYTTKSGYELVEIRDTDEIVWSSQGPNNVCIFARVTFRRGVRSYLRLHLRLEDGKFRMQTYGWDNRWRIRDGTIYESEENKSKMCTGRTARLRYARLLLGSRGVKLDLTSASEAVAVSESTFQGVTTVLFTVAPRYFFTSIVEGKTPIWNGNPGEICTIAKMYSDFTSKLLKIHVKNRELLEDQYYDRSSESSWARIEKPTFEAKVDEMEIRGQINPQVDLTCYERIE